MDSNHRTRKRTDLQSVVVAAWLYVLIKRLVLLAEHLEHPFSKEILQFAVIFVIITDYVICGTTATIILIICSVEQWRVWDSNSCVAFQRPNGLANRPLHQTWVTLQFKMRFQMKTSVEISWLEYNLSPVRYTRYVHYAAPMLVDGIEPPTSRLQVEHSTYWIKLAKHVISWQSNVSP